jgi:ribose transport system permease protein
METNEFAYADSRAGWTRSRLLVRTLRFLNRYSFGFALVLAIGLLIANLVQTPNFGWTQQLATFAPLALAGMASTPSIVSGGGGFDLSISPVMILTTGVYIVWLTPHGLGGAEAVPVLLLLGAAIGTINGLLILVLRIPPVVVTLSTYFILIGVNLKVIALPAYIDSTWMTRLGGSLGLVPGALFTIAFPLAVWAFLGLTPYRRALYAVGTNDVTAFSSGVSVGAVRVIAYGLGGLFAAVGGIAIVAVTQSTTATLSGTYTLAGIAAVAMGGTSLWGGSGGLGGSLIGAASIYLLGNLLITLNVNPSWLQVMYGLMLLLAVVLVGLGTRARSLQ